MHLETQDTLNAEFKAEYANKALYSAGDYVGTFNADASTVTYNKIATATTTNTYTATFDHSENGDKAVYTGTFESGLLGERPVLITVTSTGTGVINVTGTVGTDNTVDFENIDLGTVKYTVNTVQADYLKAVDGKTVSYANGGGGTVTTTKNDTLSGTTLTRVATLTDSSATPNPGAYNVTETFTFVDASTKYTRASATYTATYTREYTANAADALYDPTVTATSKYTQEATVTVTGNKITVVVDNSVPLP